MPPTMASLVQLDHAKLEAEILRQFPLQGLSYDGRHNLRLICTKLKLLAYEDRKDSNNIKLFEKELLEKQPFPTGVPLEHLIYCWKQYFPIVEMMIPQGGAASGRVLRDQYGFIFKQNPDGSTDILYHYDYKAKRPCTFIEGFDNSRIAMQGPAGSSRRLRAFLKGRCCVRCGTDFHVQGDHRTPRKREQLNGNAVPMLQDSTSDAEANAILQPLCSKCNEKKSRACERCVSTGEIRIDPLISLHCPGKFPERYTGSCVGCFWHDPLRSATIPFLVQDGGSATIQPTATPLGGSPAIPDPAPPARVEQHPNSQDDLLSLFGG
ncbi:MAG: hypothetical protein A2Y38_15705 [Spirochaetes bacterium GWB1_59_5]|nr:MAG: hypothetical protein A2Y38_15705 [Spirochaetes bacterium GWB1_59_5]